jgi:Helicase conserved C-terminal domain/SNF2-related domain
MPPIAGRWNACSSILAESLQSPDEPLAILVGGVERPVTEVCSAAGRALLGLDGRAPAPAPNWLLKHQVPAYERLWAILEQFGGGLLADAVGLGKSYVSLAIARTCSESVALVVPAVLVHQWTTLARRVGLSPTVLTHERLSRPTASQTAVVKHRLVVVDEAHRFRSPTTRRYRALARLAIGARVLLVTATPVHNRPADLIHLFRLFLRDDALVALGVPSLARGARTGVSADEARRVIARLVVARSRGRVATTEPELCFPRRRGTTMIRVGPTGPARAATIIERLRGLGAGERTGPLLHLTLLHRFASSLEALRHSVRRYEAYQAMVAEAAATGRRLHAADFQRLFPPAEEADLQLAFLPLLLEAGAGPSRAAGELTLVLRLLEVLQPGRDPKADALAALLAGRTGKTIVFSNAAATVRHLQSRLVGRFRIGAVTGTHGWLGRDRVPRVEVLAAFAPRALGAPAPVAAAAVDVLITTDLLSEGLNLQDAERIVHYDLPWSPARLAQRAGRIDRLGSRHESVETVTFLPPVELERALAIEGRLAGKVAAQVSAGSAQVETVRGPLDAVAPLDWCDRLQGLVGDASVRGVPGLVAAVNATCNACVLIMRLGTLVDAIVIENGAATADPQRATDLLEAAVTATPRPVDRHTLGHAVRAAAPLLRHRMSEIAAARWRAADRDRLGRRFVPLVLVAARRAARAGQPDRMARLDGLMDRLTRGLKAGEELQLEELAERPAALDVGDLLAWHERLPPNPPAPEAAVPDLVAAVLLVGAPSGQPDDS